MHGYKILLTTIISVTLIFTSFCYSQEKFKTTTIKIGDKDLVVEIASTPQAREKGLMYRKVLPEGRGMLFVYPEEISCKLWMKNTFLPLSAAFIREDGLITQIVHMEEINSTKIHSSNQKVKYALEMPLGYFKKNGIKVRDYCTIPGMVSE